MLCFPVSKQSGIRTNLNVLCMKNFVRIIVNCCILFLSGCDDFFEKDLTGKQVNLVAPGDSVVTSVASQLFLWEELPGAAAYRLLIVVPDFRHMEYCLLDTLIEDYRFEYLLPAGTYTWGIRAENSAWKSEFVSRVLTVTLKSE